MNPTVYYLLAAIGIIILFNQFDISPRYIPLILICWGFYRNRNWIKEYSLEVWHFCKPRKNDTKI